MVLWDSNSLREKKHYPFILWWILETQKKYWDIKNEPTESHNFYFFILNCKVRIANKHCNSCYSSKLVHICTLTCLHLIKATFLIPHRNYFSTIYKKHLSTIGNFSTPYYIYIPTFLKVVDGHSLTCSIYSNDGYHDVLLNSTFQCHTIISTLDLRRLQSM